MSAESAHLSTFGAETEAEIRSTSNLRFFSPQSDTSLHYQTTDTWLVHHTLYLFTPQLSLVLTAPTHGGIAGLNSPGWLVTYQDHSHACHPSK